jgi:2-polyprenyl-3-methyl-5-hydroxy-6-metoxy-1,4-benzoquinol methylase
MKEVAKRTNTWEYGEFWDNPSRAKQTGLHEFHKQGLKMILPGKGKKCLDLGSASGDFALKLKEMGYDVTATDFDERAIEMESKRGLNAIRLDVERDTFPFKDRAFDLVTCFEVIEHIKTANNMLTESRRVLKDDGIFVTSTPNICWWYLRLKHLIGKWDTHDPDHIRFYTPSILRKMLREFGFEVEGIRSYFVCPHFHLMGVQIPPEPLRVFGQPMLHGISNDFILRCRKRKT